MPVIKEVFLSAKVLLAGFVLVMRMSASAGILLDESFSYTDGALVTVGGGAWTTHSGTDAQMDVISGGAELDAAQSEDVNRLLAGQPYPSTTNTVLYVGFVINFRELPSPSGEYFAHFKDATTSNFRAKIFALSSGAESGKYYIGLANGANEAAVTNSMNLDLNSDYRIVIRYVISNAIATLWVEPTSEASTAQTAGDIATPRGVMAFALRQSTGMGVLQMDDLRVGTTFAEVCTPPPLLPPRITQAPINAATVESGTAVFSVAASGTAPLSYQWRFNVTDLPGATNATLNLNNVQSAQAGNYSVTVSNVAGTTNSAPAVLTVIGPSSSGTLTLVTYNVKGNFASDWTTNAPQLQAVARQMNYLNPDIITFNEIPNSKTYEMTNFVNVYLPGYFMATNSGTDGSIRSVIVSRYPIARSQKWLDGAGLTNFGYAGTFTRDLFEAEITVPRASEPLHVFTTHLKSGSDGDSQDRRAAEASAISNFLVSVFIPSHGHCAYVLTGDLNEDIDLPLSHDNQPIQRLTAAPTGLHLTTPLNPFTLSPFTHSIQIPDGLDARFDYILPAGVLCSNLVASEVFRTDVLESPPPPLLLEDSVTASDHLPVVMTFNYPDPPLLATVIITNGTFLLKWPGLVGRRYAVESSVDLTNWSAVSWNIVALSGRPSWSAPVGPGTQFYRVVRLP